MNYTFSVVLDVSLTTLPIHTEELNNFTAVVHSDTLKLIQSTLANAIKIREPLSEDIIINLWNPNYIKENIKIPALPQSKPSQNPLKETESPLIEDKEILLSSPEALRYLTKHEAQKMQVFPLRSDKDSFVCATVTSQDLALINKLRLRTGKKILCMVFPLRTILDSIESAYPNIIDTEDRSALLDLLHH